MAITIKDIAKELGVSPAAVSKALNNRPGIGLPLKLKIEKAARRLNYAPYLKARQTGMYERSMKYIAVIYARAGEHLVYEIEAGIKDAIKDSGFYELRYTVDTYNDLYDNQRKEVFLDKILHDNGVVGLISAFLDLSDSTIARLQKSNIPVVLLNNYSDYGQCVLIDNVESSFEATKRMLELGRKKIGLIMPEESSEFIWQDRLEGYKKALKEKKVPYDPYLIVYEHTFSLKESGLATKALMDRMPDTDAIIYGSDLQAYGGLKILREMGTRVPEDVAVLGFDDMPFSRITDPPLASVRQPMKKMGEMGAKLLLDAVTKKKFPNKVVVLKSEIVLRKSCQKDIPEEKWIP
ncbi:MAG: LacI family DNA-binding transcriptional regulator [Candidatus Omnitrophota bacterium]